MQLSYNQLTIKIINQMTSKLIQTMKYFFISSYRQQTLKTIASILFALFLATSIYGQCNVTRTELTNGYIYYLNSKETLFVNDDFHNGVQTAFAQLFAIQLIDNPDMMQFGLYIEFGRRGNKQMIVPRNINFKFTDGTTLFLAAETLDNPRSQSGFFLQKSTFRIDLEQFIIFQTKSISETSIFDHRTSNQIKFSPYRDILLEQANCIAKLCCLD